MPGARRPRAARRRRARRPAGAWCSSRCRCRRSARGLRQCCMMEPMHPAIRGPRPAQALRRARGRARDRLRGRAAARSSACSGPTARARRRPSRSSRATARARAASSRCSASTPADAPARAARAGRHRAAELGHVPPPDRARGGRPLGAASTRTRATSTRSSRSPASTARRTRAIAHALRRPGAAARPRARAGRRPRADLPRRADDRLRPAARRAAWDVDPLARASSARRCC